MLAYLFLGVLVLVGVILLMRWAVTADPELLARILKIAGAVVGAAGALLAVWRAPVGLLLLLLAGTALFFLRRAGRRQVSMAGGPSAGTSDLRTAMLDMTLEHATGRVDGTVLGGAHRGQRLSALSLDQLVELLEACRRDDPESVPVLEAFLDRSFGETWREGAAQNPGATRRGAMSREEALDVLGLGPAATPTEIRDAHRRLMQKLHPDAGGSSYLAARINQARDLLLGD